MGEEDDGIDLESLGKDVDSIEDSLNNESSFLDKLLFKLSNKEKEDRVKKHKIKDLLSKSKNREFFNDLKEKSLRAKSEEKRLSGFLNRFRSSQHNIDRHPLFRLRERNRFRNDPLRIFKDTLGLPQSDGFRSTALIEDDNDFKIQAEEESRSSGLVNKPAFRVGEALKLVNNIPKAKTSDGHVFV